MSRLDEIAHALHYTKIVKDRTRVVHGRCYHDSCGRGCRAQGEGGAPRDSRNWQPVSCYYLQISIDSDTMNIERLKRITVEEGKCGGRPCIRGLRIRVSDVLDLLAAGASFEEILSDYPTLEREDIIAAIEYAARLADHVVLRAS